LKLTENEVRYVANLANLSLTEEEVGRMVHDLGGILEQMDRLAEIDTAGVAPMAQVLFESGETATWSARRSGTKSRSRTRPSPAADTSRFRR
jgi:aspartyl-tRNA(Asn)/glutamyl-tRNA(Gln) amidotransferase subunit C